MDMCFFPLLGVVRSCDGFGQLILVHSEENKILISNLFNQQNK